MVKAFLDCFLWCHSEEFGALWQKINHHIYTHACVHIMIILFQVIDLFPMDLGIIFKENKIYIVEKFRSEDCTFWRHSSPHIHPYSFIRNSENYKRTCFVPNPSVNVWELESWSDLSSGHRQVEIKVEIKHMASLVAELVKNLPAMQEAQVWSLGSEDALEKEMATHFSILAWRIPWIEEPGGLQSMESQRVGHDGATNFDFQTHDSLIRGFH